MLYFSNFVMPPPLVGSNISAIMRREFDAFIKLSSKQFSLTKSKVPKESFAGSSHAWVNVDILQDNHSISNDILKVFDINNWNNSLLPGVSGVWKVGMVS